MTAESASPPATSATSEASASGAIDEAKCTPNSLSQDVGLGLGAQAGERLRKVFQEAGFSHFRRAAETPMNLILEARP